MLTIHEWLNDDDVRETVELGVGPSDRDGMVLVRVGKEPAALLPVSALAHVMERYGKPIADDVALDGPRLDLGGGQALHRIRHRARYDVISRDFLVWTTPGKEPLADLAISISAPLVHLAKAARSAMTDAARSAMTDAARSAMTDAAR